MDAGDRENRSEVGRQKKALRRELLATLKAITPAERLRSDALILQALRGMPSYQQASRLFLYVGTAWEVDTRPLIEEALAAGKQVAVPRCLPLGIMEACLIRNLDELRLVPPLGLWEPEEGAPVIEPALLDFAVIPCVACDRSGQRLGRGGGYYDRFLAEQSFTKAALCRQAVLQDSLPTEAFDQRVDYVVTDGGIV